MVDTLIGALLTAAVATVFLGTLVAGGNAESSVQDAAASQEQLRRALTEVLQDVRSAEPVWFDATVTPAPSPERELRLIVVDPDTAAPTYVRWRVISGASGPERGELVREVFTLDASRAITNVVETYRLDGVDTTTTSFAYSGLSGSLLPASSATPADLRKLTDCTRRVTIAIRAAASGRHPTSVYSDGNLRNHAESPWWCA